MSGLEDLAEWRILTPEMLLRRIIHDAFEDPAMVFRLAGLTPEPPDMARAEEGASSARLRAVGGLIPALTHIARQCAHMATRIQVEGQEATVTETFTEEMEEMFFSVIQSSVIATVSVLVDLDVLRVGPEVAP